MKIRSILLSFCAAILLLIGCSNEGGQRGVHIIDPPQPLPPFLLGTGMQLIQPESTDTLSPAVDLSRFGASAFDLVYELETPSSADFTFNLIARTEGNFGQTTFHIGHVSDGGAVPQTGVESFVFAGLTLEAPGMAYHGDTVSVTGDGFVRGTVRGRIQNDQVAIVIVPTPNGPLHVGVRISIGATSPINQAGGITQGVRPNTAWHDVFSSDSLQFGLPSVAASGDHVSIVAYDGDPAQRGHAQRQRRWLQLDATTGTVTGGAADCVSIDSGFWRDQEVAAQGDVLAVAYTASGVVKAEVSLDNGASFGIEELLDVSHGMGTRLAKVAIGDDYQLGVLYWRNQLSNAAFNSELVLVEATPTGFDVSGTPSGYTWQAPTVIHNAGTDVTPLLMHLTYSTAGDLVVGYGYTSSEIDSTAWTVTTSAVFRCAVRLAGATMTDKELDREQEVLPADPHVCVLGSGPTMEIFYTYEKTDGVHLLYSSNAGQTFQPAGTVAIPGAFMPSVHARIVGGQKRVDLLYCSPTFFGHELHNLRWSNFSPGATPDVYHLTSSGAVVGGTPPPGLPQGLMISTLAWFGYDAKLVGDSVVVAVHELTYDMYEFYWTGMSSASPPPSGTPVITVPGLNDPVTQFDANQRSRLRVAVLD